MALRMDVEDGFARLWHPDYDRPVALIAVGYNHWTSRPVNVPGCRGWAFICPTRREAVAAVKAWLEARGVA